MITLVITIIINIISSSSSGSVILMFTFLLNGQSYALGLLAATPVIQLYFDELELFSL